MNPTEATAPQDGPQVTGARHGSDTDVSNVIDVFIVGAGLAGLSLARQLLLARPGIRILMVDRSAEVPTPHQKVGEATVQVSGYYYSRVLEMEEHLLCEHYLKYNLRFYWKSGRDGKSWEDLSQSYIRNLSNIATYQLDRNKFEAALLAVNRECPSFELVAPATDLDVQLDETGAGPHRFRFRGPQGEVSGAARWVIDSSGRGRFLARRLGLRRKSPIHHGSSFLWVDGLCDPEKMTDLTPAEIRKRPDRKALGHLPTFLATNHFCGEGFWFWEIPLHGKTSLGLVFDADKIPPREVGTPEKLFDWICREYPLFARDLPQRRVVDFGVLADFAHDGAQTLSASRWAMCGISSRFSDPLYSPGGDLISIYNTVTVDAILTDDPAELARKVRGYEALARAVYEAYVPSFAVSYDTLGDQEAFTLRYVWELTIYFGFYVFPFINDLFTDQTFLPGFLRRFSRLGPINAGMHRFLNGYYHWKKANVSLCAPEPVFFEFMEVPALRAAEACFYKVGVDSAEARQVLDGQLANLEELARWTVAYLAAVVLGEPRAASNAAFMRGFDIENLVFDPAEFAERWQAVRASEETYPWSVAFPCMKRFRQGERRIGGAATEGAEELEPVEARAVAGGVG